MEQLICLLSDTRAGTILAWCCAIIAAGIALWTSLEKYRKLVNTISGYRQEIETDHANIGDLQSQVNDLKKQDISHYDSLKASDTEILKSVSDLSTAVADLKDYQQKKTIADLKDRIRHYYYIHHKTGEIDTMAFETMQSLIKVLEDSNEHNSFVHEVIEPEMYTWKIVNENGQEDMLK